MAKFLGVPNRMSNGAFTEFATTGAELVVNGDFSFGTDQWTATNATLTESGGELTVTETGGTLYGEAKQSVPIEKGKAYVVTVTLKSEALNAVDVEITSGSSVGGGMFVDGTATTSTAFVTQQYRFAAYTDTAGISLRAITTTIDETGVFSEISIKEALYSISDDESVVNGDFITDTDWTKNGGATITGGAAYIPTGGAWVSQGIGAEVGRIYNYTLVVKSDAGAGALEIISDLVVEHYESIPSAYTTYTGTFIAGDGDIKLREEGDGGGVYVDSLSVKAAVYNNLQSTGESFLTTAKVGDVVFNTSDNTEAVVTEVVDDNTLTLSNENLSFEKSGSKSWTTFAANGDTRGNTIFKIDDFMMSNYDLSTAFSNTTWFFFSGGVYASKLVFTSLNMATDSEFVSNVIERNIEVLNSKSATVTRLDIPLNEFRDSIYNEVLAISTITTS